MHEERKIALKKLFKLLRILADLWRRLFSGNNISGHEGKKSPAGSALQNANGTCCPVFDALKKDTCPESWNLMERNVRIASRSQKELAQNLAGPAVPKSRYEKISEINRYRMIETDYNYQRYLSEILFCTGNHVSKGS